MDELPKPVAEYPIQLVVPRPEHSSRLLALATLIFLLPKAIILLPHLILVYFLSVLSFLAAFVGQLVVLITGSYPQALFDFVAGALRWQVRVSAYIYGLTDEYPPFSLT